MAIKPEPVSIFLNLFFFIILNVLVVNLVWMSHDGKVATITLAQDISLLKKEERLIAKIFLILRFDIFVQEEKS